MPVEAKPRILLTPDAAEYVGRSVNFVRRVLRYEVPVVQHGPGGPLGCYETDLDPHWVARCPVAWHHADGRPDTDASLVIDVKPGRAWPQEVKTMCRVQRPHHVR